MSEHAADGLDARVERFLAGELARAEADLQRSPIRPRSRAVLGIQPLSLVATVAVAVALLGALIVLRPSGVGGGPTLGPDGIPFSIDGEPVLRADAIAARLSAQDGDGSAFLAGGFLVVDLQRCRAPEPSTGEVDCGQAWFLRDDLADPPGSGFPVMTGAESPGFVRTSGAATVAWVRPAGDVAFCGLMCPNDLMVESTAWRQPTKGPVPEGASPPEGGITNLALVPDFVEYVGRGETVIGYIAKDDLLLSGRTLPGSPSDPPQEPPLVVYGEDLVSVIGHDVPGVGFVAAGASIPPVPSEPVGDPSQGPSRQPTVAFLDRVLVSLDDEPVLAGSAIRSALLDRPGTSFLVTGVVGTVIFDCEVGGCPESTVWVLGPPGAQRGGDPEPGLVLLVGGGTWSPPSDERWAGDLIVLRVRAYDQPCPWGSFCDGALLVEDWIPAP